MSVQKDKDKLKFLLNPITLVTGLIFLVGLILVGIVVIVWGRGPTSMGHVTPEVTIISAPTFTPQILSTPIIPTQTPTTVFFPEGVIGIGIYVQVSGTDGAGLRMRSEPGLSGNTEFTALDAEVFLVIDGPVKADGYDWWHLEAPYDQSRNGWSAGAFLTPIYEVDD
ncbi:MAG: hypothetical protein U9R53_03590 [Chloroflexota bacterium]|nr:hypothetical protein [Chloroflexota bacterium]